MDINKIELHAHLEGSAPPKLIKKLALRNNITIKDGLFTEDESGFVWSDFLDFLNVYDEASKVIRTPDDYYDITYEYLAQNAKENCIYTELMYSPEHAERASGIPSVEHLNAIQSAIDNAERDLDVYGRILITAVRHYGVEAATKVALDAAKRTHNCIVGFGMGGDEAGFPPGQFRKAYEIAAAAGLGATTHAGEMAGPEGMIEALDNLSLTRLGHGVRCIEDSELMKRLVDEQIHLEVCPLSNIATRVYSEISEHPLRKLFDAGISISLGSDDPPYFHTTIGKEYQVARDNFDFGDQELKQINGFAVDAAFCDSELKEKLKARLT